MSFILRYYLLLIKNIYVEKNRQQVLTIRKQT